MQLRRIASSVAALWLLAWTIVALHHEAQVAHVRDGHGQVVHAEHLGDHTGTQSDYHASTTSDHDLCGIGSTLHQAAQPAVTRPIVCALEVIAIAPALRGTDTVAAGVYRFAPKTSPPHVLASLS